MPLLRFRPRCDTLCTMKVLFQARAGRLRAGRPHVVTVRGDVAARDGAFVGTVGRGQFLKREPTHF